MWLTWWKLCRASISLWLEHILTHGLQLSKDIDPLLLGDVEPLLYSVDLVIYVVVKLLVESVFNILVQIVVDVVVLTLHHRLLLVHLIHVQELVVLTQVLRCHILMCVWCVRGIYRRHIEVLVLHRRHVHHVAKAWDVLRHVIELRWHILNAVSKVIVRYLTER